MATRKELVGALRIRYRNAALSERIKILDEFVALTGYRRKHAIRVLREEAGATTAVSARNRLYDEAVRQALIVLWEAADRVCGKRLKALIPLLVDAMERHGHLDLDPAIKSKVMQVSAATIDRALAAARLHIDGQRKRRKGTGMRCRFLPQRASGLRDNLPTNLSSTSTCDDAHQSEQRGNVSGDVLFHLRVIGDNSSLQVSRFQSHGIQQD